MKQTNKKKFGIHNRQRHSPIHDDHALLNQLNLNKTNLIVWTPTNDDNKTTHRARKKHVLFEFTIQESEYLNKSDRIFLPTDRQNKITDETMIFFLHALSPYIALQ